MSVPFCTSEPMVGSESEYICYCNALKACTEGGIDGRTVVMKCVMVPAETRNAVHEEMAAQGSFDDYLHIVVSRIALFALAVLPVIHLHAHS